MNNNWTFPYHVNGFYRKSEIWRPLGLANQGGIRPNKARNFVVVFFDAPDPRRRPGRSYNIYADFYDRSSGLIRYTGEGQEGDQQLSRGNLWLADARKRGTTIHLFMQHHVGGLHEYIGEVEVESFRAEVQGDVHRSQRKVLVFQIRPISPVAVSEKDATDREIEFEIERKGEPALSQSQLEHELQRLAKLVRARGSVRQTVRSRTAIQYVRFKAIVTALKTLYKTNCQICGDHHFETRKGFYSEVHHLLPWAVSHDDQPDNLVVICANCHRKLHYAKSTEIDKMYDELTGRFPHKVYKRPIRPMAVD